MIISTVLEFRNGVLGAVRKYNAEAKRLSELLGDDVSPCKRIEDLDPEVAREILNALSDPRARKFVSLSNLERLEMASRR